MKYRWYEHAVLFPMFVRAKWACIRHGHVPESSVFAICARCGKPLDKSTVPQDVMEAMMQADIEEEALMCAESAREAGLSGFIVVNLDRSYEGAPLFLPVELAPSRD